MVTRLVMIFMVLIRPLCNYTLISNRFQFDSLSLSYHFGTERKLHNGKVNYCFSSHYAYTLSNSLEVSATFGVDDEILEIDYHIKLNFKLLLKRCTSYAWQTPTQHRGQHTIIRLVSKPCFPLQFSI